MIVGIADRERSETSKHDADRYYACNISILQGPVDERNTIDDYS
jgi:hypothetical protein